MGSDITGLQSDSASSHPTILCRELLRWNIVLTPCSPLSLLSLLTDSSHSVRAVERQQPRNLVETQSHRQTRWMGAWDYSKSPATQHDLETMFHLVPSVLPCDSFSSGELNTSVPISFICWPDGVPLGPPSTVLTEYSLPIWSWSVEAEAGQGEGLACGARYIGLHMIAAQDAGVSRL